MSHVISKSSLEPLLLRLAAVLISVVLSLIAIEIAMHLLPKKKPVRVNQPLFKTILMPRNSLHYRDFEYPRQKGLNVFRILVVGDSFSQGAVLSFEDSYAKKLECYLNCCGNDNGTTYQVINMSVQGRSTPREVRVIKHHAAELEADLVILGYCLNDPEDWEEGDDYLRKLMDKCYYRPFKKPEGWGSLLYEHSALVRLIQHRIFNSRVKRGHIRYFHKLYRDTYPGWQKAQRALMDLGDFSRSSHIPVRVLIFPLTPFGLGDEYPFADIHEKLHSALEKAGLPYIDLFPLFKDMDHTCLEFVPSIDAHPSEIASRMAAEALWQELMREGVTPEGKRSDTAVVFPKYPPKWR
jgi:hypothetical protein